MDSSTPRQRRALFVIDIQNELAADASTKIPHAERIKLAGNAILNTVRGIIDDARRSHELPPFVIVVVQHEEPPEEGTLVRNTDPWKVVFEPRQDVDDEWLVAKTTRDTFESNPDLAERLRRAGVTEISAFGIQSDACVEATCNGALDAGFAVTLLSGAHSTYDSGDKTAVEIESLIENRLQARGAVIMQWDGAVLGWEKSREA